MIIGIDIGLTGAVCFYEAGSGYLAIEDMPVLELQRGGKKKREIDVHSLAHLFYNSSDDHAYIEMLGAMPGQGVSSVFALGKSFGVVLGILAARGIPYTLVHPRVWKGALGVPAAKDGARARASQLLPGFAQQWSRVKDHGRAEAALIALYGHRASGKPTEPQKASPHIPGAPDTVSPL